MIFFYSSKSVFYVGHETEISKIHYGKPVLSEIQKKRLIFSSIRIFFILSYTCKKFSTEERTENVGDFLNKLILYRNYKTGSVYSLTSYIYLV